MEIESAKKLEKELANRTSEGFNRYVASMSSFQANQKTKNAANTEKIADYIVQRDNAYDQKLIKTALESDASI